jgi:hypothetical protein
VRLTVRGMNIQFGSKFFKIPGSRLGRLVTGTILIVFGVFGFLPVLGFWMIPLGLVFLSVDFPLLRRFRRRATIAFGRWAKKIAPEFWAKCIAPLNSMMTSSSADSNEDGKRD